MSEFKNYFNKVNEDADEMVNGLIEELLNELKDTWQSINFATFYRLNERYISEYNDFIIISLRDAVEIIEQSTSSDAIESEFYSHVRDCRENLKTMAFYIYKNDLNKAFKDTLKKRLGDELNLLEDITDSENEEMENYKLNIENFINGI